MTLHEHSYRVGMDGPTFVEGRRAWSIEPGGRLYWIVGVTSAWPRWRAPFRSRLSGRRLRVPWWLGLMIEPALNDDAIVQLHEGFIRVVKPGD